MSRALPSPDAAGRQGLAVLEPGAPAPASTRPGPEAPAWAAVGSMTLGVFALMTAEFLPAGLLTPIASSLGITEGAAGRR